MPSTTNTAPVFLVLLMGHISGGALFSNAVQSGLGSVKGKDGLGFSAGSQAGKRFVMGGHLFDVFIDRGDHGSLLQFTVFCQLTPFTSA
jgi:hypothetical protein